MYKCAHPILLAVIENHPWRYLFNENPLVPQVYLQQLYGTLAFQEANQETKTEECLTCTLDDLNLEITVDIIRFSLRLPVHEEYESFPASGDAIMLDVQRLGYTGPTDNITKLNWDSIPTLWATLLQLMCHSLTHKSTVQDYATRRTILFWTGFTLEKKYD